MTLHLVVDHGRLWIPPDVEARARAQSAAAIETARKRTAAHLARKAGEEQRPRRGATGAQAGEDPRAEVQKEASASPVTASRPDTADPGAVRLAVPLSPSSSGTWLLVLPYVAGLLATIVGFFLAVLFGGVR